MRDHGLENREKRPVTTQPNQRGQEPASLLVEAKKMALSHSRNRRIKPLDSK